MKILCVNFEYSNILEQLGHEILSIQDLDGVVHLPSFLNINKFSPDLIIQQEKLGPRLILRGLEQLPCPKLFWSIDTHLNLHWQRYYAQLFDAILTPHYSLLKPLQKIMQLPPLFHCPLTAPQLNYKNFTERKEQISFIGRFTEHRPLRQNLKNMLTGIFNANFIEEISHADMLKLYCDSKIVPNESLAYELNLRIFEAAGAGALVLSQDVGEDQNAVFTPNKECVIWQDSLELIDLIKYYLKHESKAQKISQAAYLRVQQEHLAAHRTQQILNFAQTLSTREAEKTQTQKYTWLSLVQLVRSQMFTMHYDKLLEKAPELENDTLITAFKLMILAENSQHAQAQLLIQKILNNKELANKPESLDFLMLSSTSSASALIQNKFGLAKYFLLDYLDKLTKQTQVDTTEYLNKINAQANSNIELCLTWSRLFENRGIDCWLGFKFTAFNHIENNKEDSVEQSEERNSATEKKNQMHIPECARSWLLTAQNYSDNTSINEHLKRLSKKNKVFLSTQKQLIQQSIIAKPNYSGNWRLLAEQGLIDLQCCQSYEGLTLLKRALSLARDKGAEESFNSLVVRLSSPKRGHNILETISVFAPNA